MKTDKDEQLKAAADRLFGAVEEFRKLADRIERDTNQMLAHIEHETRHEALSAGDTFEGAYETPDRD